jgi:hypothetical protein
MVSAEEKVATANVWICSTLIVVGVTSGVFPPPHEASRMAPSARRVCTFINLALSIHTPFNMYRSKIRIFFGILVEGTRFTMTLLEARHKRRYFT